MACACAGMTVSVPPCALLSLCVYALRMSARVPAGVYISVCVGWYTYTHGYRPPAFKPHPPLTQHTCSAGGSRVNLGNDSRGVSCGHAHKHISSPTLHNLISTLSLPYPTRIPLITAHPARARACVHTLTHMRAACLSVLFVGVVTFHTLLTVPHG